MKILPRYIKKKVLIKKLIKNLLNCIVTVFILEASKNNSKWTIVITRLNGLSFKFISYSITLLNCYQIEVNKLPLL